MYVQNNYLRTLNTTTTHVYTTCTPSLWCVHTRTHIYYTHVVNKIIYRQNKKEVAGDNTKLPPHTHHTYTKINKKNNLDLQLSYVYFYK